MSFKGKVDARQTDDGRRTTDAAPCHKLNWPFRPGELTSMNMGILVNIPQINLKQNQTLTNCYHYSYNFQYIESYNRKH